MFSKGLCRHFKIGVTNMLSECISAYNITLHRDTFLSLRSCEGARVLSVMFQ